MEDRMGDSSEMNTDLSEEEEEQEEKNVSGQEGEQETAIVNKKQQEEVDDDDDDDDDDEEEEEEEEQDDASDADYVQRSKNNYKNNSKSNRRNCPTKTGRGRRRLSQPSAAKKKKQPKEPILPTKESLPSLEPLINKPKHTSHFFDYRQSELLQNLRYAFERLPATDLWYRVFARQDACEERYFEYFGDTQYRKLPYELGPMPFDRTTPPAGCCKLCNPQQIKEETVTITSPNTSSTPATSNTSSYAHKHKKLHLLQRYRQEQQALLEQQQQRQQEGGKEEQPMKKEESDMVAAKASCDSQASSLEPEALLGLLPRERAGSTSSCASSSTTSVTTLNNTATTSRHMYRNKHLNKAAAAFLSLEMPPRKSPREHASTLALVSCLIKQRQESKPNSDADEPRTSNSTPTPLSSQTLKEEPGPAPSSPLHNTRSAAATPIEEIRFATEISENVKRMRRGQNKYDHSPPYVFNTTRRVARNKCNTTPQKQQTATHQPVKQFETCGKLITPLAHNGSVRKTGQKKGVQEFEVDNCALRALDAALEQKNVRQLERQIDHFLDTACKGIVPDLELLDLGTELISLETAPATNPPTAETLPVNTPPPTDYFSSDFDLCDILGLGAPPASARSGEENAAPQSKHFNVYNSLALNNYYRKRKYLKSNRTGWPKVQRKKYSMRQQQSNAPAIKPLEDNTEKPPAQHVITPPDSEIDEKAKKLSAANEEEDDVYAETLADSIEEDDNELLLGAEGAEADIEEDDDEEEEAALEAYDEQEHQAADRDEDDDGNEPAPSAGENEDSQTENQMQGEGKSEQVAQQSSNYDNDDNDDEEQEQETEEDEAVDFEPQTKRARLESSLGKALANCFSSLEEEEATRMTATTSTPSTHMLRGLRRTPQLNGSLGSCISPSEKAGDNSDIFTVSSDGLDTDLDLSNPHSQSNGDEQPHICANHTPTSKRKYDISKYVPNPAANTCAAEVATAAAKSLAIAQFLKKEVRVTCRRIRAPFRRFRYRR